MLRFQGNKELSLTEYKNVFTFPIIKYYERAGIDFSKNSFKELAVWFIAKYQPLSMECGLYEGLVDALIELKAKGYITVSGRVNYQYFNERIYGAERRGENVGL
mgnify:CR=1 FL=1